jgi:hypothetical protein
MKGSRAFAIEFVSLNHDDLHALLQTERHGKTGDGVKFDSAAIVCERSSLKGESWGAKRPAQAQERQAVAAR